MNIISTRTLGLGEVFKLRSERQVRTLGLGQVFKLRSERQALVNRGKIYGNGCHSRNTRRGTMVI